MGDLIFGLIRDIKFVMDKPEHAVIIKKVLDVDPELKPSLITREIEAHPDGTLLMYYCLEYLSVFILALSPP
jgi:hypothetical protein